MLYIETVEPHTFSLLEQLLALAELRDFSLVGVTALSLLYGHRKSVDLDLFSSVSYDNAIIINALQKKFKTRLNVRVANRIGIFCFIDGVKIDLVFHPHPLLRVLTETEGIRMFSPEDIIAMKVQAVLGRGKKKDFWDIAELLRHFTVEDFIRFHAEKYSTQNLLITVPQAITYFADAEEDEAPVSLRKQNWDDVKKQISVHVTEYLS